MPRARRERAQDVSTSHPRADRLPDLFDFPCDLDGAVREAFLERGDGPALRARLEGAPRPFIDAGASDRAPSSGTGATTGPAASHLARSSMARWHGAARIPSAFAPGVAGPVAHLRISP
jgi:hypothetical protein